MTHCVIEVFKNLNSSPCRNKSVCTIKNALFVSSMTDARESQRVSIVVNMLVRLKFHCRHAFYTLSHGKIWHSTKLCSWQTRPSAVGQNWALGKTRHVANSALRKIGTLKTRHAAKFAEILHSANSAFGEILHSAKNLALDKLGIWQTSHITNVKFAEVIDYI